jgi:hypothetical protein
LHGLNYRLKNRSYRLKDRACYSSDRCEHGVRGPTDGIEYGLYRAADRTEERLCRVL